MKNRDPRLPKIRNPYVIHARSRNGGPMHDKRAPRGGSRNRQRDYRDENF